MKKKFKKLLKQLNVPESSIMLGSFRIIFGLLMGYHILNYWDRLSYYKDPGFLRFPYPELDWIPLFSYDIILVIFCIGLLSALLFILGVFYRYASVLLFMSFAYLFSMDSLYYNNHYYLLILLSFLMIFCSANASIVLFKKPRLVPYWNYLILQIQLGIVFFYGGLTKINADWLGGHTLGDSEFSIFQNFFLGWSGMIFDLLIPIALFARKTRWIAIALVLIFNISNHFLFNDIGAYPLLVCATLLLFLEKSHRIDFFEDRFGIPIRTKKRFKVGTGLQLVLGFYLIFQLLFPLRHHLMLGHPEWTGQGHYFSWRMKSYQKQVELEVFAYDRTTHQRKYQINTGLDNYRVQKIGAMPHKVLTLAKYLKGQLDQLDGTDSNLGIALDYTVSLNGLPAVKAIDPEIDVSNQTFNSWASNDWILEMPKRE